MHSQEPSTTTVQPFQGGTGVDSSHASGCPRVANGVWSVGACSGGGGGGGPLTPCGSSIGSSCYILGGTYTQTTTISASNLIVQCYNHARIVQQTSAPLLTVTGSNVTFDGCTLDTNSQTSGSSTETVHVSNAQNFTWRNGGIINHSTQNYAIRVDSSNGVNILNNTCDVTVASCAQVYASSGVLIDGNKGTGNFNIQSPGTGGAGKAISFTNNYMIPTPGTAILGLGDFSGGFNPIDGIDISNNQCVITGPAFGCYTIVGHVSNCSISGNTMSAADGANVSYGFMELGVDGCSITNNVFQSTDSGTHNYGAIVSYGGPNVISGNTIIGWGHTGDAIRLYAQNADGSAHNSDNNLISGNVIIGVGNAGSSFGIDIVCNNVGSSLLNTKILGNKVFSSVPLARGINVEDDAPSLGCPTSVNVDNNEINGATVGIQIAASDRILGKNDMINVMAATQFGGLGTTLANLIQGPVQAPSLSLTAMTPSPQALCVPSSGGAVTNVGCAPTNAGQVSFTPTGAGWYRIINGGSFCQDHGIVDIYVPWNSNYEAIKVEFALTCFAPITTLKVSQAALYGGGYGPIDQIRASNNGFAANYLDIHFSNITNVGPVTMIYNGPAIPSGDIVTSPVVGAVVGSTGVSLIDLNTFNIGTPQTTQAVTGINQSEYVNALSGYQLNGTAPLGHILSGNGTYYVDGTLTAFSSSVPGIVPASGGGTTNFLRADGTWTIPSSVPIAVGTPATSSDACTPPQIMMDTSFIYTCVATNTWVRGAMATW